MVEWFGVDGRMLKVDFWDKVLVNLSLSGK